MYEKVLGKGFYIIDDLDLNEEEFVSLSSKFGKLWTPEDHHNAKENLSGNTVKWSSKSDWIRQSIPWHADNPASKEKSYPLRTFYSVSIPDSDDAKLYFLDTTKAFSLLSDSKKEHLRKCNIIVGDDPHFKRTYGKWEFEEHWEEPFVKIHPILKTENINYGCMALASDAFGLEPDEGYEGTISYNKAILHPDGTKWSDNEISDLFKTFINSVGVYEHKWKEKQFLVMDNSTHLHYKQTTKIVDRERLIWRRTVFQPWQSI